MEDIAYHFDKYFNDGLKVLCKHDISLAKQKKPTKLKILSNSFIYQILYHKGNIVLKCKNNFYHLSDVDVQCLVDACDCIIEEKKEKDGWLWIKCKERQ